MILLICLALGLRGSPAYARANGQVSEPTRVILMLREQARLTTNIAQPGLEGKNLHRKAVLTALKSQARDSQAAALARLQAMQAAGTVKEVSPLWITNAIAVTATPEVLDELASLPGVAGIVPDTSLHLTGSTPSAYGSSLVTTPSNLSQVGAVQMWQAGFTGKGVVVANVDSGVSLNNTDLAAKWRGSGGNVSASWFDTHGEHATPYDNDYYGHGTATMGLMVSTSYGMAPDAQWIAVKMFSDSGSATVYDALQAFQWILAPGGSTANAPDVINNSWSENATGCVENTAIHTMLQSLLAAGILPVFSAGNLGPADSSDPYPSNYPEVLAVGAVDSSNAIQSFSSRGPTSCRPAGQVFPDLVAPGLNILSAGKLGGSSASLSGTSFSAPHAAGALALLLSAYPNLSAADQRNLIRYGAIQINGDRPNNTYGYGLLNVYTSYLMAFFQQGNPAPNKFYLPIIGH